ncbi:hypothetical protein WMY93_004649 [Mugilogobius chulae]|uniref:Chemokine interleukin-8-like domain-containing protein n=1 Tax=Mugilogobius chulae TaxID=88201 RepID=A0AAW0PSV3_9GOBI
MSAKTVLCVAALLLCIASLHARPRFGCVCIRTISKPISLDTVHKIEVRPVSGACRRTEIRITRKNKRVVCANPEDEWVQQMLLDAQRMSETQTPRNENQI